MSNALFSRVQARVLGILFGEPEQDFPVTEIISRAGSGRGAVQRELEKLTKAGILATTAQGGRRLYHANKASPIFTELRQLVLKTIGIIEPIRAALAPHQALIASAFVYGSIARGDETAKSDIDLMILAHDLAYGDVFAALEGAEKMLARMISPNMMTPAEWHKKLSERNSFVVKILTQPKLFLIGTEDELRSLR
ncbi:MAG: MarR family transcriptional regulator [Proteobacteria bacterium]|nr:MarR family transcriptional regulator [Pseudomonadota bacterium]